MRSSYTGVRGPAGRLALGLAMLVSLGLMAGCGDDKSDDEGSSPGKPGGSLTVALNGVQWPTLDPPMGSVASFQPIMDSIYGQLFKIGADNKIVPDLASGYEVSDDGKTVVIAIRDGIKFSDGTPFDGEAVAYNIKRDLDPANPCSCQASFGVVESVSASGNEVTLQLSKPYAPIIASFIGAAPNWIASPTALEKDATAFAQMPVGAGPFKVVSNQASSTIKLEKNPDYIDQPKPYLSALTFTATADDQSTIAAMQAGQVQLAINVTSTNVVESAEDQFVVEKVSSPVVNASTFNTKKPPFDNELARQAVIYATNAEQLLSATTSPDLGQLSQSATGPGSLFFKDSVPGYRGYDLEKAKALVQQLGGLSFTLQFVDSGNIALIAQALQNQLSQAGIEMKLEPLEQPVYTENRDSGNWAANITQVGGYEPVVSQGGFNNRFGVASPASGVNDPELQNLLDQSVATDEMDTRSTQMEAIYQYLNDHAYLDVLYASSIAVISNKSVDLTINAAQAPSAPKIDWADITN